jgi:Family of unknown function (DUF6173)
MQGDPVPPESLAEALRRQDERASGLAGLAKAAGEERALREEMLRQFSERSSVTARLATALMTPRDPNLASEFRSRLLAWIHEFELGLDSDTEVGARLVSFGQSVTFHLESIGFQNPSLLRFDGVTEDGRRIQLIQHVSQISVLLTSVPKAGEQARRIGFIVDESDEGSAQRSG